MTTPLRRLVGRWMSTLIAECAEAPPAIRFDFFVTRVPHANGPATVEVSQPASAAPRCEFTANRPNYLTEMSPQTALRTFVSTVSAVLCGLSTTAVSSQLLSGNGNGATHSSPQCLSINRLTRPIL